MVTQLMQLSHGASTKKRTPPNPCLVFSESDSKVYTNFELSEEI